MEQFCCLLVQSFTTEFKPVRSALLEDKDSLVYKKLLSIANELTPNTSFSKKMLIGDQEIVFNVFKYPIIRSLGSITGSLCQAHLQINEKGAGQTSLKFILNEKSTSGHNPKDFRIPCFS